MSSDAKREMSTDEMLRAMLKRLSDLNESAYSARQVKLLWNAVAAADPSVWRFAPEEHAVAAANACPETARQAAEFIFNRQSKHDKAVLTLALTNNASLCGSAPPAVRFVRALAVAWRFRVESGAMTHHSLDFCEHMAMKAREAGDLRRILVAEFPNLIEQLKLAAAADLNQILHTWVSNDIGRPTKCSRTEPGSKWKKLAKLANKIGIMANSESIKKATNTSPVRQQLQHAANEAGWESIVPPCWCGPPKARDNTKKINGV